MGAKRIELQTEEVEGTGKRAYEIGTYNLFGENDRLIDEGKYTVVWQREGGEWKLHRDIWNSSQPAADARTREEGLQPGMLVINQNMCPGENMETLEKMSDELFAPVLDELVDEGKLNGWGELTHGWGDEWSHNVYFAVKDHQAFVDFWETFVTRLSERDAERAEELQSLCTAHKDNMYTVRRMR